MAGRTSLVTDSRAPALLLAVLAVVLVPLSVFASKGVAALCAGAAVVLVVMRYAATRTLPRPPRWLSGFVLAIAGWGTLTALWAVEPLQTLGKAAQLLGGLLAGLVLLDAGRSLDEDGRRTVRRGLMAGAALGLATLGFEAASDALLTRLIHGITAATQADLRTERNYFAIIKNSAAVSALLAWPVAVAMGRRFGGWTMWAALVAALILVVAAKAHTAAVAMAMGLVVFALARHLPRLVAGVMGLGMVIAVAVAPLVPPLIPPPQQFVAYLPSFVPNSIHHRLMIWRFVAERIAEHPLRGWGLDAARSIPGGSDKVHIVVDYPDRKFEVVQELLPLHPHNTLLQWWLELGLPGATLAAALVVMTLRRLPEALPERDDLAAALALMVTVVVIANSSYGAFQSWWLGAVWLAVAFLAAAARPPPIPSR